MRTIVKSVFGSRLYGTNSEKSDNDYKGIYLPELKDAILNKYPKSIMFNTNNNGKNTSDDIDTEFYSLQYFIKLAIKGETVAFDMLFTPENQIVENSWIWNRLVDNRDKFLSKNIRAFMGYAKNQAAKYGLKTDRLKAIDDSINIIETVCYDRPLAKLTDIWDNLYTGKYVSKTEPNVNGKRMYQILDKRYEESCLVSFVLQSLNGMKSKYGNRTKESSETNGVDWKAVSHAVRVVDEVIMMARDKHIVFPLPNAPFIKEIKEGKYSIDFISEKLDSKMKEATEYMEKSDLPEKVDENFWDDFIYQIYRIEHLI